MSFKLSIGRVATLGVDACHNEAIIAIYPKNGVDQRFLGYALAQVDFDELQDRQIKGNTLNQEKIDRIPILLPPSPEQRRIADVLDLVRRGIRLEVTQVDLSQSLKRAAMRELFTRGLRGEAQKETEIGPIPESWELVPLEQYADAISKGSSPKWQGFDYVPEGVLFVRSQNVGDGILDLQDRVYLHPSWNAKERRSVLKTGDVLINLVGASIGRAALGDARIEGANCNQAVCFVRLREGGLLGAFVTGFLMSAGGQDQMHGSKKDVARANLSLEDVRGFRVPKPKMDEQQEIVAILDAIDRKIALHKEKRAVLEALFKSLLHKLMTGEVRVADLNLDALGGAAEAA
jgi:type I restriction enzyme S subunit